MYVAIQPETKVSHSLYETAIKFIVRVRPNVKAIVALTKTIDTKYSRSIKRLDHRLLLTLMCIGNTRHVHRKLHMHK